jgi:hypothetical protein
MADPGEGQHFNPYGLFHNAWVPAQLLQESNVSDGAKLLYGLLRKYAGKDGNCFPLQRTLARDMGRAHSTVRAYFAELKAAKLISVKQRGKGRSSRYHFLWKSSLQPVQMMFSERQEVSAMPAEISAPEAVHGSGSLTTNCSSRGCGNVENSPASSDTSALVAKPAGETNDQGRGANNEKGLRGKVGYSEAEERGTAEDVPLVVERSRDSVYRETIDLLKQTTRMDKRAKSTPSLELLKHLAQRGELWTLTREIREMELDER